MHITGIICEYNPLHLGHAAQIRRIRQEKGSDCGIVCLMSGNYVQRGAPALIDKTVRARAAVLTGADLVLELPVTAVLSSAEGFASRGVRILSPFCDSLCFGAENADLTVLLGLARALLSEEYPPVLRRYLDKGLSFPAARQAALEKLGQPAGLLMRPNNILAVEYCKAILAQESRMEPFPIFRQGDYHALAADCAAPSATSVRSRMLQGLPWEDLVPEAAVSCYRNAVLHTTEAGERAVLYRLRTMTEEEFSRLPYGSEGLWRKWMHVCRRETGLFEILDAVKSKRYPRTRLDRMLLCAVLGITEELLSAPVPYVRVLAFSSRGREILNLARKTGNFPNIGENLPGPWQDFEIRCSDLYGLFALSSPEAPGSERKARVFCLH